MVPMLYPRSWKKQKSLKTLWMNKKQKNLLIRIIIATVFFIPLYLILEDIVHVDMPKWALILLFLIPYLTVGWDVLRKAALAYGTGACLTRTS